MSELKLVIFDMDGVLIDSENFYMRSEQQVVNDCGKEAELSYFRKYCGTTQDYIWSHIKEDFELSASVDELKKRGKEALDSLFRKEQVQLISHVNELFSPLKDAGFKIAVASSTAKELIIEHLTELGIYSYFDLVKSGEEVAQSKPNPDVFLAAAKELGIPKENCLVVEDSTNGILAAKRAGMVCIGYNNLDYPPVNQEEANWIITDMSELTPYFVKKVYQLNR